MSIFGRFERKQVLLESTYDFENELLHIQSFEASYQHESFSLFINGNKTFHDAFNLEHFIATYQTDQSQAFRLLKGGFCGVIWDAKKEEIAVFTDPFGIYPIYYAHDAYKAIFAQSFKTLIRSKEVETDIDAQALLDFFRFDFFLPSKTIARGIHQLEAGKFLSISEDHFSIETYFKWDKRHLTEFRNVEEVMATIDELMPPTHRIDLPLQSEFTSFRTLVEQMDLPILPELNYDNTLFGFSELFAYKEVFEWLPELNQKKWPMSFSPVIRAQIHKLGLWNWKGLQGNWRKEKLLQEYWDVEFLYQFEHLKRGDEELKSLFSFETFSKNGVFEWLHNHIGYGNQGYLLPLYGRISLAELYTSLLSIKLPRLRFFYHLQDQELDLPTLSKELFAYVLSVPDGLKEKAYSDNLGQRYSASQTPSSIKALFDEPTAVDWEDIEKGLRRLPYCNHSKLMKLIRKKPTEYESLLILGLWLTLNLDNE